MKKNQIIEAVALKYPASAVAPLITAKEKGCLAEKMIRIAEENHIPVVHNQELENILSVQDIGACIPEETWRAVASIFACIQMLERENGSDNNRKFKD